MTDDDKELFIRLKKEAAGINLRDRAQATKWFNDHAFLSIVDASWIFGVSTNTIREARSNCCIRLTNNKNLIHYAKYYYTPQVVNKCRSYTWLYYHYVTLQLSVSKCAKLAGVSSETMHRWMAGYRLPMRETKTIVKIVFDENKSTLVEEVPSVPAKKPRRSIEIKVFE